MNFVFQAIESFGISFELNYSSALSSSINRRDFIMLGRALAFNTKAKVYFYLKYILINFLNMFFTFRVLFLAVMHQILCNFAHLRTY